MQPRRRAAFEIRTAFMVLMCVAVGRNAAGWERRSDNLGRSCICGCSHRGDTCAQRLPALTSANGKGRQPLDGIWVVTEGAQNLSSSPLSQGTQEGRRYLHQGPDARQESGGVGGGQDGGGTRTGSIRRATGAARCRKI